MEAKEFEKYKGCKTTGRVDGRSLEGGRIIGYDEDDDDKSLLAIDDTSGWDSPSMDDVVIPNDKDRKDYFDGKHKYLWVGKNNVFIEKDLDLTKKLRGCEGVELFSEVFGVVELYKVMEDSISPICIKAKEGYLVYFTIDGKINHFPNGNCVLWPSETNRDWSTFVAPVKVRDDDWVVACDIIGCGLIDTYKNIDDSDWKYVIRFEDWRTDLTEEELEKLSVK